MLFSLVFSQQSVHRAWRVAMAPSATQYVWETVAGSDTVSWYHTGVFHMREAMIADQRMDQTPHLLAFGVLIRLALTPLLHQRRYARESKVNSVGITAA